MPPEVLTEGITWVMTGIGIGMALGSFATGWVVDEFGARQGFWVSVASAAGALVTVLVGQRALSGDRTTASRALMQPAE